MKHNFFFLFISFIYIYHFYFKIMSHPPRTSLTSRSSTRSQPSSAEHDSTEQLRASLTRRSRNRRAAILARRRASGQNRSGNGTRGTTLTTHEHQPNSDPDNSVISNSIGSFDNIDVDSDVNVVQQNSIACDIVPADSQRTMKWKIITIPLDPIMKTNSNEWECRFSTPLPSSFLKPHLSYNILP